MRHAVYLSVLGCLLSSIAFGGTIKGSVTYEGAVPPMRALDVSGDPHCHAMRGEDPPVNEALVLGEDQRMANILVWVSKGLPEKEYPAPSEAVVLRQEGCQYVPHVFVVRQGQELRITNPDGILHNVNAMPKTNTPFNLAMPGSLEETVVTLDDTEQEPFEVRCDIHPWMRAYGAVLDHPYYRVTERDGQFEIGDLPAGEYELSAWHEKLGTQTVQVRVTEESVATQDFLFSRP